MCDLYFLERGGNLWWWEVRRRLLCVCFLCVFFVLVLCVCFLCFCGGIGKSAGRSVRLLDRKYGACICAVMGDQLGGIFCAVFVACEICLRKVPKWVDYNQHTGIG